MYRPAVLSSTRAPSIIGFSMASRSDLARAAMMHRLSCRGMIYRPTAGRYIRGRHWPAITDADQSSHDASGGILQKDFENQTKQTAADPQAAGVAVHRGRMVENRQIDDFATAYKAATTGLRYCALLEHRQRLLDGAGDPRFTADPRHRHWPRRCSFARTSNHSAAAVSAEVEENIRSRTYLRTSGGT